MVVHGKLLKEGQHFDVLDHVCSFRLNSMTEQIRNGKKRGSV